MAGLFDFQTNPILHADFLENLQAGNADFEYESSASVMVKLRNRNIRLLSSFNDSEAKKMLESLPDDPELLIIVRGPYLKKEAARYGFSPFETGDCYQFVYTSEKPLPEKGTLSYCFPEPKDFNVVRSVYQMITAEELQQEMYDGCFIKGMDGDGNFTCFIGVHYEQSMGLLFVFPEYRRKGYAQEIYSHLINMRLEGGHIPYCHVLANNQASIRLQNKLGFTCADGLISWLHR